MNHSLEISEAVLNTTRKNLLLEKLKEVVHLMRLVDIDKADIPEFYTDIKISFKEILEIKSKSIVITLSGQGKSSNV